MTANTPKSYLTLSAAGELNPQADRSATARSSSRLRGSQSAVEPASVIAAELRRIDVAKRRGAHATARRRLDRLIDYVWFSDPDGAA